ncbi:conserved hypothetical protein [Verrucomicrobia bacterium]|nr:conserved hypothetical protein [Verrucomicrobiota bacterium]
MNLKTFPLAWRWTQPSHAVLPPEVLAQIRPMDVQESALLWAQARAFHANDHLLPSDFGSVSFRTTSGSAAEARSWLREQQSDCTIEVFVLWDSELAVSTTWRIFTEYWDDFCYPASDDVAVWPMTAAWVLLYHHYEQFEFGRRPLRKP